jgi:hypothetical protein
MPKGWTLVLAVVPAGVALGALLGAAAVPPMKDAPAPWWRLSGRDEIVVANQGYSFVEAGPEDLDPGGYRPDLDYDAEVRAPPIPADELAVLAAETPVPTIELPLAVSGTSPTESAADEAESAAEDALASTPGDVRKSELALAGLY